MMKPLPDIRTIAVFRALQLGDMLCCIPAVRAIRAAYPGASITLVGLPWQANFAARFDKYFDDFIVFPGWPGLPEQDYRIENIMGFLQFMQDKRFDLVLQMQSNGYIVNPMCMLWGSRFVAGLRKDGDFCPDPKLFPATGESEHEVHRFLRLAAAVGAQSPDDSLEFPISRNEEFNASAMLRLLDLEPGKFICVHPGARDPWRRWDPCNFARVADAIVSRGYQVLLTGSGEESEILLEVEDCMEASCVNLVDRFGQTGIGELASIIKQSAGLVCNDTGVSHVASALGVRSVVIFSKHSDPARWAPSNGNMHYRILCEEARNVLYVVNAVIRHFDHQPQIRTSIETT